MEGRLNLLRDDLKQKFSYFAFREEAEWGYACCAFQ